MVSVGIFWVIYGKLYYKKEKKDIAMESIRPRSLLTGIIDSDFGHFTEWDELCGRLFPRADFATYPRGRVVFGIKTNKYIIYADECVLKTQVEEIAKLFEIGLYEVRRDEHYACDKCVKRKRLFN